MEQKFRVIKRHLTEYPKPINFSAGDGLAVGEIYLGNQGWYDG